MSEYEWISRSVIELESIRGKLLALYTDYIFEKDNDEGLTHVQTVLMRYLLDKESATVSAIADYMGVTMAAVSSLVDRLVKSGLLNRNRSESDRRVVYISLTPAGREAIGKFLIRHRERMEQLFAKMGRDNAQLYIKAQRMLLETLEKVLKDKEQDVKY